MVKVSDRTIGGGDSRIGTGSNNDRIKHSRLPAKQSSNSQFKGKNSTRAVFKMVITLHVSG